MGKIIDSATQVGKGLFNGAKKLFAPTPKTKQTGEKSFWEETPEEYGKRLMQRRSRKY